MKTAFAYQPVETVRPEPPSAGKAVIHWGFLLLVAGWMFGVGVVVGRYTSPTDFDPRALEKELDALRAEEIRADNEKIHNGLASLKQKESEMDFYHDLRNDAPSKVGPPVSLPEKRNTPVKPADKRPENRPEVKRALSTKKAADPVRKSAADAEPPRKNPGKNAKPSIEDNAPSVVSKKARLGIQIASFARKEDADRTVSRLQGKGYSSVSITRENVSGIGMRYRVRVGRFDDRSEADKILNRLIKGEHFSDAFIFTFK